MQLRRTAAIAVVAALAASGCGAAEKLSPRVAVRDAAKSTAHQRQGRYTLRLLGSEADINTLFNDGAELTAEDRKGLEVVRDGYIVFSAAPGRFGIDVKAGSLEHAFEARVIDKRLYARADVAGIAKLADASKEEIDSAVGEMAAQKGFGFVRDAAAGKWLVADLGSLTDLAKKFGDFAGAAAKLVPPPEGGKGIPAINVPGPEQVKALRDGLGKALSESIDVKKLKSDDAGDHYVGSISSTRAFYDKVKPVLDEQIKTLHFPFYEGLPDSKEIPERPVSLDVWIKSKRVSRLEVELGQFTERAGKAGRVALRLDIDREAPALTAPPDAVTVDLAGLVGQFITGFLGGGGEEGPD